MNYSRAQTVRDRPSVELRRLLVAQGFAETLAWYRREGALDPNSTELPKSGAERQAGKAERDRSGGVGRVYAKAPLDDASKAAVSDIGKALIRDKFAGATTVLRAVNLVLQDPEVVLIADRIVRMKALRRKILLLIVEALAPEATVNGASAQETV